MVEESEATHCDPVGHEINEKDSVLIEDLVRARDAVDQILSFAPDIMKLELMIWMEDMVWFVDSATSKTTEEEAEFVAVIEYF